MHFLLLSLLFALCSGVLASDELPLPIRAVNLGVTTFVDTQEEDWLTYTIVNFSFGPDFRPKEGQLAILYCHRERHDEMRLNSSVTGGQMECPLPYLIGNQFIRVDVVDEKDERIIESTRVILTGYGKMTLKFRESVMDPASWLPSLVEETEEEAKNWQGKIPTKMMEYPALRYDPERSNCFSHGCLEGEENCDAFGNDCNSNSVVHLKNGDNNSNEGEGDNKQTPPTSVSYPKLDKLLTGRTPCSRLPRFHSLNETARQIWAEESSDAVKLIGWFSPETMQSRALRDNGIVEQQQEEVVEEGKKEVEEEAATEESVMMEMMKLMQSSEEKPIETSSNNSNNGSSDSFLSTFNATFELVSLPNGCASGSIHPCRAKYPKGVKNHGCVAIWNSTRGEVNMKTSDMPWFYIPGLGQQIVQPAHKKVFFFTRQWVQNHQHFLMDWIGPAAPAIAELIHDPEVLFVVPYGGLGRIITDWLDLKDRVLPFVADAAYCAQTLYYPVWHFTGSEYIVRTPEMMTAVSGLFDYIIDGRWKEQEQKSDEKIESSSSSENSSSSPPRNTIVYMRRKGLFTGRNVLNAERVETIISDAVNKAVEKYRDNKEEENSSVSSDSSPSSSSPPILQFAAVDPGEMSIMERRELLKRAVAVIGMHGGAFANIVFAPKLPDVECDETTSIIEFVAQDHLVAKTSYDQPFLSYWYSGYSAVFDYHLVGYHGDPAEAVVDEEGLALALDSVLDRVAKILREREKGKEQQ